MEFKLPDLGEDIESGDVVALQVSVGDRIERAHVLQLAHNPPCYPARRV